MKLNDSRCELRPKRVSVTRDYLQLPHERIISKICLLMEQVSLVNSIRHRNRKETNSTNYVRICHQKGLHPIYKQSQKYIVVDEIESRIHNGSSSSGSGDENLISSIVSFGYKSRTLLKSTRKNNNNNNLAKLVWPTGQSYEWDRLVGISKFRASRNRALLLTSLLCVSIMMIIILAISTPVAEGVDCFKCSSRNGSNPACEDPFHNLNTTRITSPVLPDPPPNVIYHTPCYAGKKGREGLFPASTCIKLTGTFDATGETLVVRHCALDSGTLTQDTELARMSHCGKFNFDGDSLKGCVLACPEDACNSALPIIQLSLKDSRLLGNVALILAVSIILLAQSLQYDTWNQF